MDYWTIIVHCPSGLSGRFGLLDYVKRTYDNMTTPKNSRLTELLHSCNCRSPEEFKEELNELEAHFKRLKEDEEWKNQ